MDITNFFKGTENNFLAPNNNLSREEILDKIAKLKHELQDQIVILGHHYQQDDIIQFADIRGDSLKLAKEAALIDKKYIIFCGVHFMAETADILTRENQHVILPDLNAGCSMADMINSSQLQKAWDKVTSICKDKIIPITYVNSSAMVKAFVGEHGGAICTSSNAKEIMQWALKEGDKVFFFPDQHLGRNTSVKLGINLKDIFTYEPNVLNAGIDYDGKNIIDAKVILWHGFCSVHMGFKTEHILNIRDVYKKKNREVCVIVHPECCYDVVQNADKVGSTSYIIDQISQAKAGSSFAVGTEINLVKRLQASMPDKEIFSLSPYQCLCSTMYRVRPAWLLSSLEAIKNDKPINIIKVNANIRDNALIAINKMLEI